MKADKLFGLQIFVFKLKENYASKDLNYFETSNRKREREEKFLVSWLFSF